MKGVVQFLGWLLIAGFVHAQPAPKQLSEAVRGLEEDSQMKYALLGFYVVDQKTGAVVFGKNAAVGLAVASTQKVITSTASLDLLGSNYQFKTELAYDGTVDNGVLSGNLYLIGYGDPTLGSWRYDNTKEQIVLGKWINAVRQAGIKQIKGSIVAYDKNFESQTIPGGWIWDDIGNYYGAGVAGINWRENQYDLRLTSGSKEGDAVSVVTTIPKLYDVNLTNELLTGKAGSGDNAYIYLPPYATSGYIRGTIPPNQSAFTISGSFPNPAAQLAGVFTDELVKQGIAVNPVSKIKFATLPAVKKILTILSPTLDSINNWFLKKSINLYGETLIKTLGFEKKNQGTLEAGLGVVKNFWKTNGVDVLSIRMVDGSGLSPQNRITPEALVKVLQFARTKPWYNAFYSALPEYNGIKMKSGTIGGVKSFTGYVGGYTFAIVINNYNGSSAEITRKMYKVLDVLK
ncbi:MAG TPA: D-alanyl-D-alanine carboxypeptidase/D-alanyl-D-alanine-endopeptidase [Segetibacter sp.]|jgi:D-alanyl-D-alanine carboxypeptidase/D-alanyl-D-alanine-endopeptidase (penicillin-binding protein 4)